MSSEDHPTRPVEGSLGPIARVRVDLGVMHLDRDFDYLVPDEWHERAVPGARVRVRFSGRLRWLPAASPPVSLADISRLRVNIKNT